MVKKAAIGEPGKPKPKTETALTKEEIELQEYWENHRKLRADLIKEIIDRTKEIDPAEERHWEDMLFGWAIGKGLSVDDAYTFADKASYEIALAYPNPIIEDAIMYLRAKAWK